MAIKQYNSWSILSKILIIPVFSIIVMVMVSVFYLAPLIEHTLQSGKKEATRQAVEVASGVLDFFGSQVQNGQMPLAEAQQKATAQIKLLRFNNTEYFWINDTDMKMVMHASKPELDGKSMRDSTDPQGKYLFREFVRVATETGSGYVSYLWPKPGESTPVAKISFVKLYKPWGWVIGSGIYIDDVNNEITKLRWKLAIGIFLFIALTTAMSVFIGRSVAGSLSSIVDILPAVAEGDLTRQVSTLHQENSEVGRLGISVNRTVERLKGMISDIKTTSDSIATSSKLLNTKSVFMANASEQTTEKTSIIAMASEEMSATSSEIARSCIHAAESSKKASTLAMTGNKLVQETLASMDRIAARVRTSATTVESLGKRSDQIGEIVNTIGDIADQTNLLALNAAIEAARAGEQGRGFAVVADEVRALADRTAKATQEINTMIKVIQNETMGAVSSMDLGVSEVEQGTNDASRSGEALVEIAQQINEVTTQVDQIAVAAEEQCATIAEITSIIQDVTGAIQETSKVSQESANAANCITDYSEGLRRQVAQFKLI